MITNKYITRIVAVIITIAAALCLCAMGFSDSLEELAGGAGVAMQYEAELFDTDQIMEINIEIEQEDWQDLLDNAISEEYHRCDVEINGTKLYSVGIRPKGNTSLSSIAMDPDTDRYSLKLEFDQYVEGQTCFGLDKLILNNNYADATNMKEAIVYDMYRYLGADASLYNYAEVSVNGEYWGIYLALEAVEDSFLMRNYGTENGELYKPESMGMGGGRDDNDAGTQPFGGGNMAPDVQMPTDGEMPSNGQSLADGEMPSNGQMPTDGQIPGMEPSQGMSAGADTVSSDGSSKMPQGVPEGMPGQMPGGDFQMPSGDFQMPDGDFEFPGGFSMGGGADLNYTDDDTDSYETIWEGSVTNTSEKDHKRVVTALKQISEGKDLEQYLDIDNVLKYMAVHTFVVNQDSLTGNMAHNYYLYETKGQLNILPWDYNLAFGGMGMGGSDASGVVNHPIDTPFSGTKFFDALLEDETYLAQYHEYLRQLTEEYVAGGKFEETYQRIRTQISSLVETDPTAFYTYEEYETGAAMLYDTVALRAQSIRGQLDGTVPSTTQGQRENPTALVDASSINIEAMGTMNMGGGGNFDFQDVDFPGFGNRAEAEETSTTEMTVSERETSGTEPAASERENIASEKEAESETESSESEKTTESGEDSSRRFGKERPEGFDPSAFGGWSDQSSGSQQTKNLVTYAVCLVVILGGILFAKFYRRRR